jgi:hypothetical protein
MAKDKTSFVLYSDSKSIIDLMTNEQAGLLLKTLFAYVNDENPVIDNSIAIVFEMIKLQLKRDLKKWEQTKEGRSAAGKASAEARRLAKLKEQNSTNSTNVDFVQQTSTNSTVSVSVNDSVNVNVINKDSKANLEIRTLAFKNSLIPFKQKYSIDMLKDFFGYWTEPNKSNTKLKFELQQTWSISRRLETWAKNDKTFSPKQQIKQDRL